MLLLEIGEHLILLGHELPPPMDIPIINRYLSANRPHRQHIPEGNSLFQLERVLLSRELEQKAGQAEIDMLAGWRQQPSLLQLLGLDHRHRGAGQFVEVVEVAGVEPA
jgi:hypothetical protein